MWEKDEFRWTASIEYHGRPQIPTHCPLPHCQIPHCQFDMEMAALDAYTQLIGVYGV